MELDYEQYKLVREALHERKVFLHTAPYLSVMQPIMLPVYKWVYHPPSPSESIGGNRPIGRTRYIRTLSRSGRYSQGRCL